MSSHRTFYYARVSSKEQSLNRQIDAFKALGADDRDIVTDTESGKTLNRPGYKALKSYMLRPGDVLVVKSLDRLSRNKSDITTELQYFKEQRIRVKILDLPTTMIEIDEGQEWVLDMVNNILIEVLGTIAEQERITTRRRQEEGIASARARGKHMGRPKSVKPENWDSVIKEWTEGKITAIEAMRRTGLKRTTFYNMVKAVPKE